jgi:hypothetical protein
MGDNAMADDKTPLMEDDNRSVSTKANDEIDETEYCNCCCCLCHCSTHETRDLTCLGCFPIKCALVIIGLLAVLLTIFIISENFLFIMSDSVAWWYVLISVLLQIPLIIGLFFFFNFFGNDTDSSRGRFDTGCMLAVISYSLQGVWQLVYFLAFYKEDEIILGANSPWAHVTSKKMYLFWSSLFYLIILFAFGYFICVSRRYWYRLHPKEKKEEDMEKQMTPRNSAPA